MGSSLLDDGILSYSDSISSNFESMTTVRWRPTFSKEGKRRCALPAAVSLVTLLILNPLYVQEVMTAEPEQATPEAGEEFRKSYSAKRSMCHPAIVET